MKKILWLASWYPSRVDAFSGDFIERHAVAVSRFAKLVVLAVIKDETLGANEVVIDKTIDGNLTVYKAYYGKTKWGGLIERFLSFRKYLQLQKQLYKQIEKEWGIPDLVHVHVAMKAGLLARHLKKQYQIPFVVTEHWTGYYPQSVPNIYTAGGLVKNLNKKILEEASLFLPVTADLGKVVKDNFAAVNYQVIPNVVDTGHFFYEVSTPQKFRFIHPSYMNYQKNPEGILEACAILRSRNYDFELLMVGNKEERLMKIAAEKRLLDTTVYFKAAIPYVEVAKEMQHSSALLLFSRFENLPCVVLEALCCGLPVISSRVGGIAEVVNERNGILVEPGDAQLLADAMQQMIDQYKFYSRETIATKAAEQFSYATVGKEYLATYQTILQST